MVDQLVRESVAELVKDLNSDQKEQVKRLTRRAYDLGWTAEELADRINTVVGLDDRRAQAVDGLRENLVEQGMGRGKARARAKAHASQLRRNRASVIARTELARLTREAQRRAWMAAADGGVISQYTVRRWKLSPDERTCPICRPMNGQRAAIYGTYRNGMTGPPVHPNCRCTEELVLGQSVVDDPNVVVLDKESALDDSFRYRQMVVKSDADD